MMRSDDFDRVEALFAEMVALDPSARASALDSVCADRPDLRSEIEALLDAHARLGGGDELDEQPGRPLVGIGSQFGAFRLIEKIGEGGMGAVFRAERTDGAFTQEVAVKVMRSTIVDVDLLHRFKVERQILASLRHPEHRDPSRWRRHAGWPGVPGDGVGGWSRHRAALPRQGRNR